MANTWTEALKKWNSGKGKYCLPKKGSKEYDQVKKIQAGLSKGKAAPKPKAAPKKAAPKKTAAPKKAPVKKAAAPKKAPVKKAAAPKPKAVQRDLKHPQLSRPTRKIPKRSPKLKAAPEVQKPVIKKLERKRTPKVSTKDTDEVYLDFSSGRIDILKNKSYGSNDSGIDPGSLKRSIAIDMIEKEMNKLSPNAKKIEDLVNKKTIQFTYIFASRHFNEKLNGDKLSEKGIFWARLANRGIGGDVGDLFDDLYTMYMKNHPNAKFDFTTGKFK